MSDTHVEFFGNSCHPGREGELVSPYDHLEEVFGSGVGVQKDYDCFKNAVHNAVLCLIDGKYTPKIFDVKTGAGRHAYFSLGTECRSNGYTWPNSYYPELSLDEIIRLNGQDVTLSLFMQAVDPEIDRHGYHHVIDNLEKRYPDAYLRVKNYIEKNTN